MKSGRNTRTTIRYLEDDARAHLAVLSAVKGKIERWHKPLKRECIRPVTPLTLEDARRLIQIYVDHYNTVRLHSAIGYVAPQDRLAGRQTEIHAARDRKLEEARRQRQDRRQKTASSTFAAGAATMTSSGEREAGTARMQLC